MHTFNKTISSFIGTGKRKVNLPLLIFLILVLNVKLLVKVAVILLFTIVYRKDLGKEIFTRRFILFYFMMAVICLLNLFIRFSSITSSYLLVVLFAIGFWMLCALSSAQLVSFTRKVDISSLHATLTAFFLINAIVTLAQLGWIMIDAGVVNPFTFQGYYQKYFINTGDLLKGVSFDVSTSNAIFNAFGVVYFLSGKKNGFTLLCMAILLLTASNFTNLILSITLIFIFIFQSDRDQKSIIIACFAFLLLFLVKISPQNNDAIIKRYDKLIGHLDTAGNANKQTKRVTEIPDSLLSSEEHDQKVALLYLDSIARTRLASFAADHPQRPAIPYPSIHTPPFQHRNIKNETDKRMIAFAYAHFPDFADTMINMRKVKMPGKYLSLRQSLNYFQHNSRQLLTGLGAGNFSSKLAFKATALGITGGYPSNDAYINPIFLSNHLFIYLAYFCQDDEYHSLVNNPGSAYDQIFSEYGLTGIAAFIFLYLGYFIKRMTAKTYAIPLFMLLLLALGIDYWFEQLSIVILFELMMLINIKEKESRHE